MPPALDRIPKGIVANPNCTTMVCMPVLAPLHAEAGLVRLVASTYQAVSGAGLAGTAELEQQMGAVAEKAAALTLDGSALWNSRPQSVFPGPIAFNVLPHAGNFVDDETDEEQKFRNESRKILGLPELAVSVTCVRVPVYTGHSHGPQRHLRPPHYPRAGPGVVARTRRGSRWWTCPRRCKSAGGDACLVGRVRSDHSDPTGRGLSLFVSGDNLRKGAALNAVQIAEALLERGLIAEATSGRHGLPRPSLRGMEIRGSSAIVTGGASGLGEATVRLLAERGVRVVVLDMKRRPWARSSPRSWMASSPTPT